jgi:hypothetical protein
LSSSKEGSLHLDLRTLTVFHLDHPKDHIGKLDKDTLEFEYNEKIVKSRGLTVADLRSKMST